MNITDKQKIKLLEWGGWAEIREYCHTPYHVKTLVGKQDGKYLYPLPDLSDLNVLHDLEGKLNEKQRKAWTLFVTKLACGFDPVLNPGKTWLFDAIHADADVRLAALCLTLNITDETLTLEGGK